MHTVCDIDDTVLAFDKIDKHRWQARFAYYYTRHGEYDFSEQAVLKEWLYLIKNQNPEPKGDYIKNAISFTDFDNIIFIDDLEQNINSVERVFGDTVHKYLFIANQ